MAVGNKKYKALKTLLELGADAGLGRFCLWNFSGTDYAGDLKKIKLLVEKGKADVNTSSSNGGDPFFLDKLYGANKNLEIAKYLIVDCKADITKKFIVPYKSEVKDKCNTPVKLIEYLSTVDGYKNDRNFKHIHSYMLKLTYE